MIIDINNLNFLLLIKTENKKDRHNNNMSITANTNTNLLFFFFYFSPLLFPLEFSRFPSIYVMIKDSLL